MADKKIKVTIKKGGNIEIETLEGFVNNECHATTDQIMAVIGGIPERSEDKDDAFVGDGLDQFLNH